MFRLLSLLLSICAASASLEQPFLDWITTNMGSSVAVSLNRIDLTNNGGTGSFGGGVGPLTRRPVVIVNGRANDAGQYGGNRAAFNASGWDANHVLATTYGGGNGGLNSSAFLNDNLSCQNVKQIRWMLEAVIGYYNSAIDVVAYSMGSPIARKAILGGNCVETGFNLGSPLTSNIHTYVSVAGANKGAKLCTSGLYTLFGVCSNAAVGLNCASSFYADINNPTNVGYEGQFRHYIYSNGDEVVGTTLGTGSKSCGGAAGNPAELPGTANKTEIATSNHSTTIFTNTAEQAAALLTYLNLIKCQEIITPQDRTDSILSKLRDVPFNTIFATQASEKVADSVEKLLQRLDERVKKLEASIFGKTAKLLKIPAMESKVTETATTKNILDLPVVAHSNARGSFQWLLWLHRFLWLSNTTGPWTHFSSSDPALFTINKCKTESDLPTIICSGFSTMVDKLLRDETQGVYERGICKLPVKWVDVVQYDDDYNE